MRRVICLVLILFFTVFSNAVAQKLFKKRKKDKVETPVEGTEEEKQPSEEEVIIERDPDLDEDLEEQKAKESKVAADTTKKEEETFKPDERKQPSKFLLALEKFQFHVSSGYGLTRWRSQPYTYNDTTTVKYKGMGLNVPIHFQIQYDFKKFRLGAGASMELYFMGKLKPVKYEDVVPVNELKSPGTFKKYYGHFGYKYFQNRMYVYLADIEVGMFKGSPAVNTAGNSMRPYVNLGITLERKYSEYFKMYLKPSIEFKGQPFTLNDAYKSTNNHRLATFYVVYGVSYSIPFFKKCKVTGCEVKVHHYHKNRLFRGNPFQRLQNPEYGEEDKTLIKFRGKNKRRIDPF